MNDVVSPETSLAHRLYHGETTYDFVGKRNIGFAISGLLLLVSVISLLFQGLNLGLDFKGGVVWEPPAKGELTIEKAESILTANGISGSDAKVQTLNGSTGERIRVQVGAQSQELQSSIRNEFATAAGVDNQEVPLSSVSATWGKEITRKAIIALVMFFIALSIFIGIRFEPKMAIGAFVAVLHDVLISVGVYSIFRFAVTPATLTAFLTILGFSLYDTIVVFDKVHENTRRLGSGKYSYSDVVNLSMNQTLMRSINTSLAAVLPVLSLLVVGSYMLGAITLREFALALLVGLLAGSYSSIFIATPLLAILKEREPKYRDLRNKISKGDSLAALRSGATGSAAAVTKAAAGAAAAGVAANPEITLAAGLGHPPRPRKNKRR